MRDVNMRHVQVQVATSPAARTSDVLQPVSRHYRQNIQSISTYIFNI
jgi:hypothetical protein